MSKHKYTSKGHLEEIKDFAAAASAAMKNSPGEVIYQREEEPEKPLEQDLGLTFTGQVYTLVHKPHEGFANYAIATIQITNGIVTKTDIGQPFNAFEAKLRMDLKNDALLETLRRNYPGDYRHG